VLSNRFGHRFVVMAGGVLISTGMVTASFAHTVVDMYVAIGVVSGESSCRPTRPTLRSPCGSLPAWLRPWGFCCLWDWEGLRKAAGLALPVEAMGSGLGVLPRVTLGTTLALEHCASAAHCF